MSEPQSTTDLRIIAEMAEEIEKHKVTALPGSLRSFVRTKRGQRVANLLEKLARDLLDERFERRCANELWQRTFSNMKDDINSEREMNHKLTMELESRSRSDGADVTDDERAIVAKISRMIGGGGEDTLESCASRLENMLTYTKRVSAGPGWDSVHELHCWYCSDMDI